MLIHTNFQVVYISMDSRFPIPFTGLSFITFFLDAHIVSDLTRRLVFLTCLYHSLSSSLLSGINVPDTS
jgi:hypothetical protein